MEFPSAALPAADDAVVRVGGGTDANGVANSVVDSVVDSVDSVVASVAVTVGDSVLEPRAKDIVRGTLTASQSA